MFIFSVVPKLSVGATETAVTTETIYLRDSAKWSANKLGIIDIGDSVTVVSRGADWSKVEYNGKSGYVPTTYLKTVSAASSSTDKYIVSTDAVYVRTGPGTANDILMLAYTGTKAKVLSLSNNWYKVDINGTIGYSIADYWKDLSVSTSTTPVPAPTTSATAPSTTAAPSSGSYTLNKDVNAYMTAGDAKMRTAPITTFKAGKYYIYKTFDGMINISTTQTAPGGWINPSDNEVKTTTPTTTTPAPSTTTAPSTSTSSFTAGSQVTITKDLKGYNTAADAAAGTNAAATVTKGTYWVYKMFSGMANLTTVKGTPGSWVNPAGATSTTSGSTTTTTTKPSTTTTPTTTPTTTTPSTSTATTQTPYAGGQYKITKTLNGYNTAADAIARTNARGTVPAGTYWVYKVFAGSANVTTVKGTPGSWINIADNGTVTTTPSTPTAPTTTTGSVTTVTNWDTVYFRDQPSTSGRIYYEVPVGTKATVIGPTVNGWLNIEIGGLKGYSYSQWWNAPVTTTTTSNTGSTSGSTSGSTTTVPQATVPPAPDTTTDANGYVNKSLWIGQLRTNSEVDLRKDATGTALTGFTVPSGAVVIMKNQTADKYQIDYNGNIGWCLKTEADVIKQMATPVNPTTGNGKVIYLDPGHDAPGAGAVATVGGYNFDEATINWNVAVATKAELEKRGYTVFLSKPAIDAYVEFYDRITTANQMEADIYVSLHCDVSSYSSTNGSVALYSTEKLNPVSQDWLTNSMRLANYLAEGMGTVTGAGRVFDDVPYTNGSLAVNRMSDMPSSLLEMGFLTNLQNALTLNSSTGQSGLATQISNGIDRYFNISR